MKTLFVIVIALILSGCVRATYEAKKGESEEFHLTSVFKSVDGLYTERKDGQFNLKIDKTHTQDPMGNMLEIMKLLQGIQLPPPTDPPPRTD